ncbi:MAG: hypothetical protein P8Y71_18125 [Pseudolabrys sp.]
MLISSVALAVGAASPLTSCATTEKPAGLAGARGFDSGIERQQIGLLGDGRDQLDHLADAAGGLRQFGDTGVDLLRLADRVGGDAFRFMRLPGDLGHRAGQLRRRRGHPPAR